MARPYDREPVVPYGLERPARRAARPVVADEGALPPVALGHRALHRRRDVARRGAGLRGAGAIGRRELLLPEFADVAREGTLEHREDLSRRIAMARQRADLLQQVVSLPVEGALEPEALGRERLHLGPGAGRHGILRRMSQS